MSARRANVGRQARRPGPLWPSALGLLALIALALLPVGAASAQEDDPTYTQTRYPIVLAHGMAGFDTVFGGVDYWYGIAEALRAGGAVVFLTRVSAFNTPEARGEQLLAQVEEIVALTGRRRVNFIGHSHGGFDSRYVASVRPDLVASITTIATPHQGTPVADFLRRNLREGGFTEAVIGALADQVGVVLALLSGSQIPQDAVAATESLTTEGAARFNAAHPWGLPDEPCGEGPAEEAGIHFFSLSGTDPVTNLLDVTDAAFALTTLILPGPDDGLVGRCSSHFGQVIRDDYPWNHGDEVNQLLGLIGGRAPDPRAVIRAHANRLRRSGL